MRVRSRFTLILRLFALFSTTGAIDHCDAQNLVPNGSFEEIIDCPRAVGQLFKAAEWHRGGVASPDLFNVCDVGDTCGVPQNFFGQQTPATGNGYCGMWAYSKAPGGNGTHEIIGARLNEPLIIGQTYWASLKVSWSSSYPSPLVLTRYATDKMGVLLKMDSTYGQSNWLPWPNYAHVYSEEVISDSLNWTVIQGHFVADSSYRFIYVGNFFGDDQTDTVAMDPNGNTDISYYYVDDVCLSANPLDCDIGVGIHANDVPRELRLWIASNGAIKVPISPNGNLLGVELFNAHGELLLASSAVGDGNLLSISPGVLTPGLYILRLTDELTSRSLSFVVPSN